MTHLKTKKTYLLMMTVLISLVPAT